MKKCLLFFIFPLFLLAQTTAVEQRQFTLQKTFYVQDIVKQSEAPSLSVLSQTRTYAFGSSLDDSLTSDETQNSGMVFTKNNLAHLKNAGSSLEWSFYLKYGANAIGLIETLTSYEKPDKNADRLVDLSKRKTFANILTFGTYALELQSLNNLGRSGTHLYALSNNLSKDNSRSIYETSRRLKKGRTYGLISTGLGIIGSTAMMYGLSQDEESKAFSKGLAIGGSFGLASLVFKFISVNNVRDAGKMAGKFSANMAGDWKKEYFDGFSNGLIGYEKHWKTGFGLTMSGIGIIIVGVLIPEPAAQVGGLIAGGLMIFAGNIYMNWVAPYSLGNAGENLTGLEDRMANE